MKSLCRIVIIGLLVPVGPGLWADSPSARFGHSMVNINGEVYLFGGMQQGSPTPMNDLWEYDATINNWSQVLAADPPPGRHSHTATVVGGKMYVIGGMNSSFQPLNDLWEYSPAANTWEHVLASNPPAGRAFHSAVAVGNKLVLVGGLVGGSPSSETWVYDTVGSSWTQGQDFPDLGYADGMASYNGKAYMHGHAEGVLYEYDVATNTWSTVAAGLAGDNGGPSPRVLALSAQTSDTAWLIGGEDVMTGATLGDAWELDLGSGTWTQRADLPEPLRHSAMAVVGGGGSPAPIGWQGLGLRAAASSTSPVQLLIFGGLDARGQVSQNQVLYDPDGVQPPDNTVRPDGIRSYQDRVNVSPGSRGFATYVNVVDGRLIHSRQDLYLPGRGLPLRVVFAYVGSGWQMNYALRYVAGFGSNEDCYLNRPNANIDAFVKQADGSYQATYGVRDALTALETGYQLTVWRDGINNDGGQAVYRYDAADHHGVTRIEDRNGNALTFGYDQDQRLTAVTDAAGRQLAFTYTDGRLTRIVDPAERQWQYTYDADGNMIQATDPAGGTTRYQYAPGGGPCTAITDARGGTWQFTYVQDKVAMVTDPSGHTAFQLAYDPNASATRVTDGNGNATVYRYDDKYRVVSVTDALSQTRNRQWDHDYALTSTTDAAGRTTTYTYDAWGNPLTITDALEQTTTYTYDGPFHQVTGFTDCGGHTTRFAYDPNGNLTTSTDALGHETTYTYDAFGQATSATDALGHTTRFEYDASGNRTKITDALGGQASFTYDALGNTASQTNANGQTTQFQYGLLGRLTKTVDALGGTASIAYDAVGNVTSRTDANGNTTHNTFDAMNRLITRANASAESTSYTYDAAGNRLTSTDNAGHTTRFEYDALNRRTAQIDPLGGRTQYAYDAVGNLTSLTDAKGNVTRHSYDALGRITATTDALGGVTSQAYDAVGNRVSRTNANGEVTRYEYDALGRQTERTTPLGRAWHYVYDAAGNLVERTDANGNVTVYTYDALNRRIRTTYPDGSVAWSYDALGRLAAVQNGLGLKDETVYEYDALGRVLSCTTGYGTAMDAQTVTYAYDPAGRRTRTTYPLGQTLEYAYDQAGRLVKVDGFDGSTTYEYDAAGRRAAMVYPNGMSLAYAYDAAGRSTRLTATDLDGQTLVEETYAYDAAGNKTHQSRDRDSTDRQIQYDALNRIASVTYHLPEEELRTYTYDAAGHRLTETVNGATTTFTYDADGRVTQQTGPAGTTTYTYDNNGNRLRKTGPDDTTTYTFDAENRMVAVSLPDEWAGRREFEYAYSPHGRKLMKRMGDWPTYYSYDGAVMIAEQGPAWDGGMWRMPYHPGVSAAEDDLPPIYPIYTTGNTSVAEVYAQPNWKGEIIHLVDFDEFGVKIKGSYEGLTQYGCVPWDPDPGYFWNNYDPQTASNTSGPGAVWNPMVQTGINTWVPQPDAFDYDDFAVSDSDISQLSQADLIGVREAINGYLTVGFFVDPDAGGATEYQTWTREYAETWAVRGTYNDNSYRVCVVDLGALRDLDAERRYQDLTGPVTDATRYSVVIAGDADRVIAMIRNNVTGREEVAGMISTQALRQGAQYTPLGPRDPSGVQRFDARNPVWQSFSSGIVIHLRSMMFQDQQRGQ